MNRLLILAAIVLICAGCSDPVDDALAKEGARIRREVVKLSGPPPYTAQMESVVAFLEAKLREIETSQEKDSHLAKQNIMSRLSDAQELLSDWKEFWRKLTPGDRVFEVWKRSGSVRCLIAVRNDVIIARTKPHEVTGV
jgi:hypothetical protein